LKSEEFGMSKKKKLKADLILEVAQLQEKVNDLEKVAETLSKGESKDNEHMLVEKEFI